MHNNILNDNRCIVVVTHDDRIYEFATRILHMEDGRLTGWKRAQHEKQTYFRNFAHRHPGGDRDGLFLQHETAAARARVRSSVQSLCQRYLAEGIVESVQSSGENVNIYPEVAGTVKQIFVTEGQEVQKGAPLLLIDDSVQRATTEQQKSAAQAARAMLE